MTNDSRSLAPEAQTALRIRTIQAIEGGMRRGKAAETFRVTTQAIRNWYKKYKQGGWEALNGKPRGRPKTGGALKGWQASRICQVVRDRVPDQLRMPFILWTADAVRELIQKKYGVKVSTRTVQRYLKTWGFTPQKPIRLAYERDPEAVRRWLEEEYPDLVKRAKKEKAAIFWGDELGLRSDHQSGRFYSPKGKTPIRQGTGKRFKVNLLSIISNRGKLAFMIFQSKFNSEVFIKFLERVIRYAKRKVILIIDSHPVHQSAMTKKWLKAHNKLIEVVYLPAYSPDLNPDEMLNHDVKANAIGRQKPRTEKEMTENLRIFLWRRQKTPHIVRRYFHEKSVRYAMPFGRKQTILCR